MNNKNNKMLKKNLFFNNNFIVEAHERFVKNFFFKKIDHKNKNKLRNLIMKRLLKNKINSSISVDSLLSSQYFSHDKEISPDRDIQRFQSLSNRFYYLRKKFRKGVFNGVLLTKNYFGITTKKIKIKLFKIFCYRLTLLNKNISSTTSSKKSFLNDFVLKSDTIKFFNLKNLTFNNPFSNFSNNFLFFFNHPRYLLFIPPKKKIIINLNNYLVPKTLFDNNFLKATNSINRLIKLSAFLKIYTQLITFNIFLKKKICVYRNELSIFLFRSF